MSWCEHFFHRPSVPEWNGPTRVYQLLSMGDEPEEPDLPLAPLPPLPTPKPDEKACNSCWRVFPRTTDFWYSHTVHGRPYLHTKCKDCMKRDRRVRDDRRRSS